MSRLHRIPIFRKRMLPSPLGIDHPVWVDDPEFDLDRHLHRVDWGKATSDDLAAWVGEYASTA